MIKSLGFASLVAFTLASNSSFAATPTIVFSSADYVSESAAFGSYIIDNTDFLGVRLTLTNSMDISYIGGNFSQLSDGNIFGAIVKADDWNSNTLAANSLAHTVFAATGGDQLASLGSTVHLAAGSYDIIFGSGQFGATGYSALVDTQDAASTSNMFQSTDAGVTISALSGSAVRVTAAAVPEASNTAMMLAGLGLTGLMLRRRQSK